MNELTMLVLPGETLPNPGQIVEVRNYLTDNIYEVKVKQIKKLRWNSKGELLVDFTYYNMKQKEVTG